MERRIDRIRIFNGIIKLQGDKMRLKQYIVDAFTDTYGLSGVDVMQMSL